MSGLKTWFSTNANEFYRLAWALLYPPLPRGVDIARRSFRPQAEADSRNEQKKASPLKALATGVKRKEVCPSTSAKR